MPLIIQLMDAHSPCHPILINANRIRAIFEESKGTRILFAHDCNIYVKESPEEVVQLIQEAVADSNKPRPSPMWQIPMWQIPMPSAGHSTSEEDMPLPDEGCVCGIHPHFDNDESDPLP